MHDRKVEALRLRRAGLTLRAIGARLGGVSGERARQLIAHAERDERQASRMSAPRPPCVDEGTDEPTAPTD